MALKNKHLTRLIRERRYDLQAWLGGDRTLGVRRLDANNTVKWRAKAPEEPRQRIALL